jgi:phosphohistidine phosphatase SixA
VRLIVVRHAHAAPGDPDELRPLSARGHEEARVLAERLAAEHRPVLVVSSPLLRARETAAPIARAAGAQLRIDERLSPGAAAEDVVAVAGGADGPVVVVGHQPDCSLLVEALAGIEVDFPPAGSCTVDLN